MKKQFLLVLVFAAGIATSAILSWNVKDASSRQLIVTEKVSPDNKPVMAIRKIKLKQGTSEQTFNAFASKVANNEYGKVPGAKFYIVKGERGDEVGTYLFVIEFDSKGTRDFYYPTEGADSTQISADARKLLLPWNGIAADFGKIAEVVTTGKLSYTDYVLL